MNKPVSDTPLPFVFTTLLPLAAVGAALYTQYGLNMMPCPWCVLQRLIFLSIAAVSLLALVGRAIDLDLMLRKPAAALALVLALCGMAAALWQHFVAAASASCVQTLADQIMTGLGLAERYPEVFAAYASCADAAVKLYGVPYEFWSLSLFALLALVMVVVLRTPMDEGVPV